MHLESEFLLEPHRSMTALQNAYTFRVKVSFNSSKDLGHFWLCYIRKTLQMWDRCNWLLTFLIGYMKLSLGLTKLVWSWMLQHGPEVHAISHRHFAMESVPYPLKHLLPLWLFHSGIRDLHLKMPFSKLPFGYLTNNVQRSKIKWTYNVHGSKVKYCFLWNWPLTDICQTKQAKNGPVW